MKKSTIKKKKKKKQLNSILKRWGKAIKRVNLPVVKIQHSATQRQGKTK